MEDEGGREDEGIVHVKRLEEIVGWCGIGP